MKKYTREQIEDYEFTKAQKSAYAALEKAVNRCEKSGLSLFGKQWSLIAMPKKFYAAQMITTDRYSSRKDVEAPILWGASLSDSGADDTDYILDEFIKD